MVAAIYARKSTEQNGVSDAERSVTRQVAHARDYAARKGWVVADDHVYVDDGISGAEFTRRPGFNALLTAVNPKKGRVPFDVLVMAEESRLGREAIEVAFILKQFVVAGVRVFFYLEDRERTLDSPTDKIMLSLTAFADELERERARQRTYDAMVRKARAGHVTGGRVFGYDNVDVVGPAQAPGVPRVRSHVERRINEDEALVVCRVFDLYARGFGYTAIAKLLNAEGALCPRPNRSRPAGWAHSSVREVLHRELYRGVLVWNQSRKRDRWGKKKQKARPPSEWVRVDAPHLRVVPEDLWVTVERRLGEMRDASLRDANGQLWGRPPSGTDSKYLLTSMARCACCGGSMVVVTRSHGRRRVGFYRCATNHRRGQRACANGLHVPMELTNAAVLSSIEDNILQQHIVEGAIRVAMDRLAPATEVVVARRETLSREIERVRKELARLVAAVAEGGDLKALTTAVRERECHRDALERDLAVMDEACRAAPLDLRRVERELRGRLDDWRGLLRRHVAQGRQILRKLLETPLTFTPVIDGVQRYYRFEAKVRFDRLIAGLALPQVLASRSIPSWNQIERFLQAMAQLRATGGSAA